MDWIEITVSTNSEGADIRAALLGFCGGDGFEVWLGGDAELRSFVKALKFAVKVLEDRVNGVDD